MSSDQMPTIRRGPAFSGDLKSLKNKVLVLPTVSQGSVPQLTVDLLIHSLGLKRLGWLDDADMVIPMIGEMDSDIPQGSEKDGANTVDLVTGGIEIYGSPSSPYVFAQQRAPTIPSEKQAHAELIVSFIASSEFSSVLILTSLDISASTDDYNLISPFRSVIPPAAVSSGLVKRLQEIPAHHEEGPAYGSGLSLPPAGSSPSYPPLMPGSGSTRRLLSALSSFQGASQSPKSTIPPHGVLAAWCAEADNRADAHGLANVVLYCLGQETDIKLVQPPSWEGLFGGASIRSGGTADLYG